MEEFSEYSSEIVEFCSTWKTENLKNLVNASCNTDVLPPLKNEFCQTNVKKDESTQTENNLPEHSKLVDKKKLGEFLKKILPLIEIELSEGVTQIYGQPISGNNDNDDIIIKPYQKLSIGNTTDKIIEYCHGIGTWLSIKTNNAPILALSGLPNHNDWCEHVNQFIKIYVPKRITAQNYIQFIELKTISIRACLRSLSTNSFNKDIFAGGTVSGDLYIWKYIFDNNLGDIEQLFCETTQFGSIISLDWLSETDLLVSHNDNIISLWKLNKKIILYHSYKLKSTKKISEINLSVVLVLSHINFIVGTKDGELLLCNTTITSNSSTQKNKIYTNPVVLELETHKFQVTSLQKSKINEIDVLVSCDLSGEIYFHDIRNPEDGPTLIVKMPLPFKNSIVLSSNTNYILSPGLDGSLEIFRVNNGNHYMIDGSLRGKGNFIKMTENGGWIITGIYDGSFQIYEIRTQIL